MSKETDFCINQKIINDYLQKNNLTKEELAKRCQIPIKEMDKILSPNTDYPIIYILRISRKIGVPFVDMFK